MTINDLAWLGSIFAQVSGLGMVLSALGIGYERAICEKMGFIAVLERDRLVRWLTLGMGVFGLGLFFSDANWIQKLAAALLILILAWISLQSPGKD